jgi:lipopolysaccharide transport system ATP-binding protein
MSDIEQFCQRVVLLDRGEVVFLGPAVQAVRQYYLLDQGARLAAVPDDTNTMPGPKGVPEGEEASAWSWPSAEAFLDLAGVPQASNGWARCTGVAVCDGEGRPQQTFAQGQMASFFYEFELLKDVEVPIGGLQMYNSRAVLVHGRNTLQYDCRVPLSVAGGGRVRFRQDVRLDLGLNDYTFEVGLATISREHFERRALYPEHVLHSHLVRVCHLAAAGRFAVVPPRGDTGFRGYRYYGVAGLQGDCQVATVGPR